MIIEKHQTLSEATTGSTSEILSLEGNGCKRLREMGLCERAQVTKVTHGRNIICIACGVKMVINRKLADQVLVSV